MVGLDVSPYAPEVARVLLLRGGTLPEVCWKDNGQRGAKKILDELTDPALLGMEHVADEAMASAVRALLYLWSGWLDDCLMCAQAAPATERTYLAALCERHRQRFAEAKTLLKAVGQHEILPSLVESALTCITATSEPAVRRLREMLEMERRWEPYLFCDLILLAGQARLKVPGDALVRQLQCREFELLLIHCYEKATGQKLGQRVRVDTPDAQKRSQERDRRARDDRRRREAHQQQPAAKPAAPGGSQGPGARAVADLFVPVRCPKCGQTKQMPGGLMGKIVRCPSCATPFEIPRSDARPSPAPGREAAPASAASAIVAVTCPQCAKRMVFPASGRGKSVRCGQCSATFVLPPSPAPAAKG